MKFWLVLVGDDHDNCNRLCCVFDNYDDAKIESSDLVIERCFKVSSIVEVDMIVEGE